MSKAIETAFREHYDELGGMLHQLLDSKEPRERQIGQLLTGLEYENLVAALNLGLEVQVSILNTYAVLSSYLDITQDQQRGLNLGQMVLHQLETYSSEMLVGRLGSGFVGVIDDIANRQLKLKQYKDAEISYKKALSIWLENKSYKADEIRKLSASIYHQLGIVAQEQRQWQQAEQYFQQALQIYIEYNDRYSQAGTYHNLGIVAQDQQQWQQAGEYLLQALQIYAEYQDNSHADMTLRNLARLWKASDDVNVRASIAKALGKSVEETEKWLLEMLEKWEKEQIGDGEKKE